MTATAAAPLPGLPDLWRALRTPALVLLVCLALLAIAFAPEGAAAVHVWIESTAYSHCFFVLPIVLYLGWERRAEIVAAPVAPLPWVAWGVVPLTVAWFAAERLGIMEGRQLVALTMLELLCLAVLGRRMFSACAAPLLYLYFLVPFGAFLTPTLQDWTAAFSGIGLDVLDIPHDMNGYLIEIPEGRFYVAEACAGLRFLIASIAFGVLYSCVMYRSPGRRIAFVVASIVIPIIANWFRALGIVVLGHILGSAQAAAADHIIYGWLFFSAVTLVLILVGLPFREDFPSTEHAIVAPPPPPSRRLLPAAAPALIFALLGPALAAGLDFAAGSAPARPGFVWTAPAGCRAGPVQPDEAAGAERQRFDCPQGSLIATAQVFPARSTSGPIGPARARLTSEGLAEEVSNDTLTVPGLPLTEWRYSLATGPALGAAITVTGLWVDGAPARGGLAGRATLARHSLFGGGRAPVLLSVGLRVNRANINPDDEARARALISGFLLAQGRLGAELARVSEPR
jgi:exosortase A